MVIIVISAAHVASEIVLAEYKEEGRAAVRLWLGQQPKFLQLVSIPQVRRTDTRRWQRGGSRRMRKTTLQDYKGNCRV